jgi:GT2 family glycosyltransferase
MKIFAVICTRDKELGTVTSELVHTLSSYGVNIKLLTAQNSIFEAYQKGVDSCSANDEDIIILCHDDLQILSTKPQFIASLVKCAYSETGIVGPAGTTNLGEDAVWWQQGRWQAGFHRGQVKHFIPSETKDSPTIDTTHYGPHGRVVALDGLFLAARKEVWDHIELQKPKYFEGKWDFYDIHYTTKAHLLGYKNFTIPLDMIHHSGGELVGRDSWHKNREAFISHTQLPLRI